LKARTFIPLLLVVAVVAGIWWWFFNGADEPVTDAEARRHLDRIVAAAQARDFDTLCRLNGSVGNCQTQLEQGCDDTPFDAERISCTTTVPAARPTIASTRYHEKDTPDGTPGRILVLKGADALGRPYGSELMVFRENRNNFKAINAVYWSNSHIIEGNEVTPGAR
jgi:hypothetical protein